MGRHFDRLVEFTRRHMGEDEWMLRDNSPISDVRGYLKELICRTSLCELPTQDQIVEGFDKKEDEFLEFHQQFLDDAQEQGKYILLPFKTTAIEDEVSVVIADQIGPMKYLISLSSFFPANECSIAYRAHVQKSYSLANTPSIDDPDRMTIFMAEVDFLPPERRGVLRMNINPIYIAGLKKKRLKYERIPKHDIEARYDNDVIIGDVATGLESYVDQAMWLWNPDNFILRKAHNTIVEKHTGELKKKKRRREQALLLKTVNRPHYICLSAEDMKQFILDESKEPVPAHFVSGHRRHYKHERYVNMKNRHIDIAQYFTGQGYFIARFGWTYMVMIKDRVKERIKLVQYDKSSWYKANGNSRSGK